MIFLSAPDVTGREQQLIGEVFNSNYIAPAGPMLERFEKDFSETVGIPHCLALSSGTAALHLALRVLNIKRQEKVWASTLTFIGGAGPISYVGAEPVFVDVDENSWCMDPNILSEELQNAANANELPSAIIPTDIYGQSCDLDAIVTAAQEYEVPVVCDSAEAVGTVYKDRHAGNGANLAIYSFNGNKIITASGGGMLASFDKKLIDEARFLSTQAREPFAHYEHKVLGYNYRMSNVMAAVGVGQLETLEQKVDRRRNIYTKYFEELSELPGLSFMPEADYGKSTRWLTVILLEPSKTHVTPDSLMEHLERNQIESRPLWKPMHMQPLFKDANYLGTRYSEKLFSTGLCLPSGSGMTSIEQNLVIDAIKTCWSR